MKQKLWSCLCVAAVSLLSAASAWSAETDAAPKSDASAAAAPASPRSSLAAVVTNDYALPEVGTLHVVAPKAWRDSFNKTIVMGTRADEIKFEPREGHDYALILVAVHMKLANARDFDTRSALEELVKPMLPGTVEKTADIHDFTGPKTTGSYLSLTDSTVSATDHKPDEFKYLTMSYAKLDTLVLTLRLVSNNAHGEEKAAALEMIKSATLTPPN
jgi:hypothetical protein